MRQHRAKHDRRQPGAGQLLGCDRDQHASGVKIAVDVEHAADPQHRHAGQVEGADVVKRAGHQQARVGTERQRDDVIHALPIEIAVGVHDAFRPVGGAGGVHQAEQLIRLPQMHGGRVGAGREYRSVDLRGLVQQDG